jgi:hypothetical protein
MDKNKTLKSSSGYPHNFVFAGQLASFWQLLTNQNSIYPSNDETQNHTPSMTQKNNESFCHRMNKDLNIKKS